jgi:hypothetical protein
MTDNMWDKVSFDERVRELQMAKYEALGRLLGQVDGMAWVKEHPDVFKFDVMLDRLLAARREFDIASAALVDFRLTKP